MSEEEKQKILLVEFNHAWEHYRHLSDARTKYMNFFFTATFGVVGFCAALIKLDTKPDFNNDWSVVGIILFYVFNVFTLFVYINVARIGHVLRGYQTIIHRLRSYLFANNIPKGISISEYDPLQYDSLKFDPEKVGIFSIQKSATLILEISMIIINISSAFMLYFYWDRTHYFYILLLILIALIIFELLMVTKNDKLNIELKNSIDRVNTNT